MGIQNKIEYFRSAFTKSRIIPVLMNEATKMEVIMALT